MDNFFPSPETAITSLNALLNALMDHGISASRKGRSPRLARNDCHTCTARRWKCDRARPRCENCQRSGKTCGGFAVQLSWQPGFSTHKKPVKRSITRASRRRASAHSSGAPQWEFINEDPADSTAHHGSYLTTTSSQTPTPVRCDAERQPSSKPRAALLCPSQSPLLPSLASRDRLCPIASRS